MPGRCGAGDAHHVGAVGRERTAAHRPGDHAREVEHAQARKWPPAAVGQPAPGAPGRRLADPFDLEERQAGNRLALRVRRPLRRRAQHGGAQPGLGRGGFERLALPPEQSGRHGGALVAAAEQPQDAVAVMGEIGVQTHRPPVAGRIDAGDAVPRRSRRLGVDARVALAAHLDGRVAHVDGHALAAAGALAPDRGCSEARGGDRRLRHRSDPEGRRQARITAVELDVGECLRLAAGAEPEVAQDLRG